MKTNMKKSTRICFIVVDLLIVVVTVIATVRLSNYLKIPGTYELYDYKARERIQGYEYDNYSEITSGSVYDETKNMLLKEYGLEKIDIQNEDGDYILITATGDAYPLDYAYEDDYGTYFDLEFDSDAIFDDCGVFISDEKLEYWVSVYISSNYEKHSDWPYHSIFVTAEGEHYHRTGLSISMDYAKEGSVGRE